MHSPLTIWHFSLVRKLLAGLHEEYQQARHWVANHLQFKEHNSVQFFEVNIRILGGLLSAYFLSDGDDMYLHKAQQLGDRWVLGFAAFVLSQRCCTIAECHSWDRGQRLAATSAAAVAAGRRVSAALLCSLLSAVSYSSIEDAGRCQGKQQFQQQ
jgi:hypothetical protein